MARDAEALVEAAIGLGPLYGDARSSGKRCASRAIGERSASGDLGAPDADLLFGECFFDSFPERAVDRGRTYGADALASGEEPLVAGGYVSIGRPRRAPARRACCRYGAQVPLCTRPGTAFASESLSDWILIRNLLSIVLRISSVLHAVGKGDRALSLAGFTRVRADVGRWGEIIGGDCFVIPVASSLGYIGETLRETVERGPIRLLEFPAASTMGCGMGRTAFLRIGGASPSMSSMGGVASLSPPTSCSHGSMHQSPPLGQSSTAPTGGFHIRAGSEAFSRPPGPSSASTPGDTR